MKEKMLCTDEIMNTTDAISDISEKDEDEIDELDVNSLYDSDGDQEYHLKSGKK